MILERITDTTLRRLYRFVLKRLLGPFIADGDLSLDQISLTSRDGIVELTELSLNCSYLNEFLRRGNPTSILSLRFKEVKVASIIAKISYSSILEDGISFIVSGVEVRVEPSQYSCGDDNINIATDIEVDSSSSSYSHVVTGRSYMNSSTLIGSNNNQQIVSHESNDTDALKFLSSWIEIIISKLRISISDITISIYGHGGRDKDFSQHTDRKEIDLQSPLLILSIRDIHFYNSYSHERHRMNESSVDLSYRAQNTRSSIQRLGKEKLFTMGQVEGKLISNKDHASKSRASNLFEIDGECKLRLSSSKNRFGAYDTDVDVSVPNVQVFLSSHSIGTLIMVTNQYIQTDVDSSKKMETMMGTQTGKVMNLMKHLERLEGKEEDSEIDFDRLNYFMEEYKKALEELELQQGFVGGTGIKNNVGKEDEDIAFPESDDEGDDYDRNNKNDESSMCMQSIYGADTFQSTMFKSTLEGPQTGNKSGTSSYINTDNSKQRTGKDSIHFRICVISTTLEMILNGNHEMNENEIQSEYCTDVLQVLFDTSIIDFVIVDNNSRMTCSVSKAVISDKESGCKILEFFDDRSGRTIISSPNIEIEVKNDCSETAFSDSVTHVAINLEPFAFILNPPRICTMIAFLSNLNLPSKGAPAHAIYHVKIIAKKIELIFATDDSKFLKVSDSLRNSKDATIPNVRRQIKRWENGLPKFFEDNISECCGFRVSFVSGISSIVYVTDGDFKFDHLHFDIIQAFLFVVSDHRGTKGNQLPCIQLMSGKERKLNFSWKYITCQETKNKPPLHDDRFKFPDLDTDINNLKNTAVIECEKVLIDLWEVEYDCCMSLFMQLSDLINVSTANETARSSQPSFGVSIESNIFVANLSRLIPNDKEDNCIDAANRYDREHFVNFYCLAAQKIDLMLCATAKKANIRLHTNDFSFLESYHAFNNIEDLPYTPILYCTKHETQVDAGEQDAFKLSILLSDEPGLSSEDVAKHATVSLKLSDVTWLYDPTSAWITDIAAIVGGEDDKRSALDLAKTQIYISVSNCVLDYSCQATQCRLLHAIEYIGLSSNMTSNSPKIGFKFVLRNLKSYISRDLFDMDTHERSMVDNKGMSRRRVVTPTFMSFLENHNFNTMYSMDVCELRLLYDQKTGGVSIETNIGFVNIGGCIDSYCTLADTFKYLLDQVQLKGRQQADGDDEYGYESHDQNSHELYPDIEDYKHGVGSINENGFMFEYSGEDDVAIRGTNEYLSTSIYQEGETIITQGLQTAILDDFYKSTDLSGSYSEAKAQWFPNYDYDDDDIDLGDITAQSDDDDDDDDDVERGRTFYGENVSATVTSSVVSENSEKSNFGCQPNAALFDVEMELDNIDSKDIKFSSLTQCGSKDSASFNGSEIDANLQDLREQSIDGLSQLQETISSIDDRVRGYEADIKDGVQVDSISSSDLLVNKKTATKGATAACINDDEYEEGNDGGWYANLDDRKEEYFEGITVENYVSDFSDEKSKLRGRNAPVETFISIAMCIRFRLYDGKDGDDRNNDGTTSTEQVSHTTSPHIDDYQQQNVKRKSLFATKDFAFKRSSLGLSDRNDRDLLEISCKDTLIEFRIQHNRRPCPHQNDVRCDFEMKEPHQFLFVRVQDVLISFAKISSKKKKVLGRWKYPSVESEDAAIKLTISTGFRKGVSCLQDLHILTLQVVPIRCYLDFYLISFVKRASELAAVSNESSDKEVHGHINSNNSTRSKDDASRCEYDSAWIFFLFRIFSIRAKIDFRCGNFNINSLREGDYSQMLNIFPLDGLEIDLQQIDLRRAVGIMKTINKSLEIWVTDVYERQLHRVISGAAPLRGLSKVGGGLQNLVYIPMSEFKKNGFDRNFLNSLKNSAGSFLYTMTTEALNVSHQLTMILANGIKGLVSDDTSLDQHGNNVNIEQPQGIQESLGMAYGALERELGHTAETVVAVPIKQYERSGATGSLRCIIRAMPVAVLRPAAGLSEALSYTLLGLRNHLNPEAKLDADDAWDANHSMFMTSAGTVTGATSTCSSLPYTYTYNK